MPAWTGHSKLQSVRRLLGSPKHAVDLRRRASLIDALAHVVRLRIMILLLDGPGRHADLAKTLRLKAGPLYFHLRVLDQAGLVERREPHSYGHTRLGANLFWCLMCATNDRRTGNSK